jgi:hypothetical protein
VKILTLDIETRPNLAWVWGIWQQNVGINQIEESVEVICFAAKWHGEHKIHYRSVYHDGKEDMLQDLWGFLNNADAVVHYNGAKFDIPHINREFLLAGMDPPAPYKQIDLLKTMKKQFRFPSNKLEYIAQSLGIGEKLKHEGFELWRRCMSGEDSAWKLMRQYNINDVALTELLYERIKPWLVNAPSFAAYRQEGVCPGCGSSELQSRGFAYTQQSKFQRYVCRDCGKWSRSTEAVKDVDGKRNTVKIREVAV